SNMLPRSTVRANPRVQTRAVLWCFQAGPQTRPRPDRRLSLLVHQALPDSGSLDTSRFFVCARRQGFAALRPEPATRSRGCAIRNIDVCKRSSFPSANEGKRMVFQVHGRGCVDANRPARSWTGLWSQGSESERSAVHVDTNPIQAWIAIFNIDEVLGFGNHMERLFGHLP